MTLSVSKEVIKEFDQVYNLDDAVFLKSKTSSPKISVNTSKGKNDIQINGVPSKYSTFLGSSKSVDENTFAEFQVEVDDVFGEKVLNFKKDFYLRNGLDVTLNFNFLENKERIIVLLNGKRVSNVTGENGSYSFKIDTPGLLQVSKDVAAVKATTTNSGMPTWVWILIGVAVVVVIIIIIGFVYNSRQNKIQNDIFQEIDALKNQRQSSMLPPAYKRPSNLGSLRTRPIPY